MRWECPHCRTALAVSDDKLSTAWTFSRCYACSGFALVRRSEINLIKVDRAPDGENVLLPEGTETPMLTNGALQNLARFGTRGNSTTESARPQIKPSTRRAPPAVRPSAPPTLHLSTPPPIQSAIEKLNASQTLRPLVPEPLQTSAPSNPRGAMLLPEPLPEEPRRPWYYRLLPALIASTGIATMGSGVYLYLKARALSHREPASSQLAVQPPRASQDTIATRAMAPERKPSVELPNESTAAIVLKAGNFEVPVFAAPDRSSNKVGTAKPDMPYVVNEVRAGWIQILIKDSIQSKTAWIPSDQAELITAGDSDEQAE